MKYTHTFTVAFSVVSRDPRGATNEEVLSGGFRRMRDLQKSPADIPEAVGLPEETYASEADAPTHACSRCGAPIERDATSGAWLDARKLSTCGDGDDDHTPGAALDGGAQ